MATIFRIKKRNGFSIVILLMALIAVSVLSGSGRRTEAAQIPIPTLTNQPRLVSMVPMPELEGPMCEWVPGGGSFTLASLQQQTPRAASSTGETGRSAINAERSPLRVIHDSYPSYSAVAV